MNDIAGLIAAIALVVGPYALGVTKVTDFVRNLVDPAGTRAPKWVWNLVAFGLGIATALLWQLDLVAAVPGLPPAVAGATGTLAQILTGVAIGGAAGYWHENLAAKSAVSHGLVPYSKAKP